MNNETKHTPGPWGAFIGNHDTFIEMSDGHSFYIGGEDQDTDKIDANAHLISAAPELLEALEALLKEYQSLECYRETVDAEIKAEHAIAKAKGQ